MSEHLATVSRKEFPFTYIWGFYYKHAHRIATSLAWGWFIVGTIHQLLAVITDLQLLEWLLTPHAALESKKVVNRKESKWNWKLNKTDKFLKMSDLCHYKLIVAQIHNLDWNNIWTWRIPGSLFVLYATHIANGSTFFFLIITVLNSRYNNTFLKSYEVNTSETWGLVTGEGVTEFIWQGIV